MYEPPKSERAIEPPAPERAVETPDVAIVDAPRAGSPRSGRPAALLGPVVYRPRITHVPSYFISRLLAFVIDVFGVAFVLATFGVHFVQAGSVLAPLYLGNFWILATGSFLAALLIAFVCEGLFGTTLGKLLFGLVVRNSQGGYAGLGRAFTRGVFRPLDLLIVGPLFALLTPKRQRLGDLVAGTVVTQTRFAPIMTFVAAAAIAAIGYAEVLWGGGMASAISVAAQSLATGSDIAQKLKAARPDLPIVSPSPLFSPSSSESSPAASSFPSDSAPQSAAPESSAAETAQPAQPGAQST